MLDPLRFWRLRFWCLCVYVEGNAQPSSSRAPASHVDWRARAVSLLKSMHEARAPSGDSISTKPVDADPNTAQSDASEVADVPLPVADSVKLQLWKHTSLSKRFRRLEQDANDMMHGTVCNKEIRIHFRSF